jgi:probable DNA repair protein
MPVPEDIQRAFASGAIIVTANPRAARWLQREYAIEQRRAGRRSWPSPAITDWDTWLRNQWQTRAIAEADAPLLLSSLQERSVWARMQREDAALLVSPASMAALAESAYALLSDYEAQPERGHAWAKTDAERFRQWAANFDRECSRRNWIPRAGLEGRVSSLLNPKALPEEVLLVGFDRTTPAQESLLRALGERGVRVRVAEYGIPDAEIQFIRTAGLREEITACAWWARGRIEGNPDGRFGVLTPDVSAMRSDIERIFRRVLMPQTDISAQQAMPFEFSLGQPLAHVPVIRAALLLLRWLHASLQEGEVTWLLLSGFLSSGSGEYLGLARQDAKRRNSGSLSLEVSLGSLLKAPGAARFASMTKLESALKLADAYRIDADDRTPGRWADLTQLLLRTAGWPGEADRSSLYFQALRRWERGLDEIALLDFDGRRMAYVDFLQALEAHALETIFAPESLGAPVQIMGALEASGQQFDALWFLSADDGNWPPRGRANSLLPNDLQRRLGMPYSNAETDLALAEAVTARIFASAPMVVFSHAERNKDGDLRPSPLLPADARWRREEAPATPVEHEAADLDEVEDASGIIAWPLERSPGGADVLKHQAACAFRAFAMKRLRAEELNRSEWGLSAAERGILLHRTLEKIWSPATGALHSLDDLKNAIRQGRLREILASAIAEVFAQFDGADDPWIRAHLSGERNRLQLRLKEWMETEAARVPFKVIACEEKLDEVNVGGLKLRLRVDRVDQVANSDCLLIDYKSGEVSPRDWQVPRPNEPQLPLYAVFGNLENVRGLLFARIRAGRMDWSGRVADAQAQLFADAKANSALAKEPYTDSMRDEWHDALLSLASDFLKGEAAVDPKQGRKTCQFCPLPGLCRVAEAASPLEESIHEDGNGNGE